MQHLLLWCVHPFDPSHVSVMARVSSCSITHNPHPLPWSGHKFHPASNITHKLTPLPTGGVPYPDISTAIKKSAGTYVREISDSGAQCRVTRERIRASVHDIYCHWLVLGKNRNFVKKYLLCVAVYFSGLRSLNLYRISSLLMELGSRDSSVITL